MAKIEPYAAKSVYDPPGYAQAVKVTGAQTILYLAGQVDYDAEGGVAHPGDFKAQVEAGGGTVANIVKINTYLTDIRHRADLVPIRQEILGPRSPASTLVAVAGLAHPDFLIEIEAVAVL